MGEVIHIDSRAKRAAPTAPTEHEALAGASPRATRDSGGARMLAAIFVGFAAYFRSFTGGDASATPGTPATAGSGQAESAPLAQVQSDVAGSPEPRGAPHRAPPAGDVSDDGRVPASLGPPTVVGTLLAAQVPAAGSAGARTLPAPERAGPSSADRIEAPGMIAADAVADRDVDAPQHGAAPDRGAASPTPLAALPPNAPGPEAPIPETPPAAAPEPAPTPEAPAEVFDIAALLQALAEHLAPDHAPLFVRQVTELAIGDLLEAVPPAEFAQVIVAAGAAGTEVADPVAQLVQVLTDPAARVGVLHRYGLGDALPAPDPLATLLPDPAAVAQIPGPDPADLGLPAIL